MRRHLDLTDIWQQAGIDESGLFELDMERPNRTAEVFWSLVIGMAMKDGAWCLRYHLNDGDRTGILNYFMDWAGYGLIPPPDDWADTMIRGLRRLTCPWVPSRLFAWLLGLCGRRATRVFDVTHGGQRVTWVANWPARAKDGTIVLFRENVAGMKQFELVTNESAELRNEVGDPH
jgi:hypothetical protein